VDNPEPSWLARTKYGLYDRVITISDGIRQVLLSEGAPAGKIVCVPSALDSDHYNRTCEKEWFCREFSIEPGNKVIGVIAQFIPRKGHRFLIEAAPRILIDYPNTKFLFFGQGPLERQLRQLCKKHNIADKVHFVGFRTDLERILPCIDLVVHPATMEGLGISLMQASATGVPIVASRVGGIPEIIQDGVNGLLVPPDDVQGLTSAVVRLLQDPEKGSAMGQAGRRLIQEEFSIEKMVEGNLRVYHGVLARGIG
jgi:glycosyltransferase involved in cell wall biosynthesis